MAKRDWIRPSIKRPGAFRKKAHKAGYTTAAYAKLKRHAKGLLGQEAREALTLSKLRRKKRRVI